MVRLARRRLKGRLAGLYHAPSKSFVTEAVDCLDLTFDGIPGDKHSGSTRRSGGREPWYPRGTELRNERQLSILAPDELGKIAEALAVPEIRPEWIGGNMLVEGIADLSWLPPRTLLFFANGAVVKVDGDNAPCRASARSIAKHHSDRRDIDFGFAKAARHRRGLVSWVEKPGRVTVGETFEAHLPQQWLYA